MYYILKLIRSDVSSHSVQNILGCTRVDKVGEYLVLVFYSSFKAKVPVGSNGEVTVDYADNTFKIKTTASGGTFTYSGFTAELEKDREYVFSF